jgi:hypothetical protein
VWHVTKLPGDREAKRRVELIHLTMAGKLSVEEACAELGIGPTRFDQLRTRMLLASIAEFSPRPVGRPRRPSKASAREIELMQRNAELEREAQVLRTQIEVLAIRAEDRRSKSHSPTAKRPATPRPAKRSDAAGGAVP